MGEALISFAPSNGGYIGRQSYSTTVSITLSGSQSNKSGGNITAAAVTISGLSGAINCTMYIPQFTFTAQATMGASADSISWTSFKWRIINESTTISGDNASSITGITSTSTNYSLTLPALTASFTPVNDSITLQVYGYVGVSSDRDYISGGIKSAAHNVTVNYDLVKF